MDQTTDHGPKQVAKAPEAQGPEGPTNLASGQASETAKQTAMVEQAALARPEKQVQDAHIDEFFHPGLPPNQETRAPVKGADQAPVKPKEHQVSGGPAM